MNGQMKRLDLSGQVIRGMTVIKSAPSRQGVTQSKTRWLVQCFCGNQFEVDTVDLVRRDGKGRVSCGCQNHRKGNKSPFWKGYGELSYTYYKVVETGAIVRNLSFDITIEQMYEKFQEQNGICVLTGRPLTLNKDASLDRINSKEGYAPPNVQWVHKDANRLKSNWPQEEFIALVKEIANHVEP